LAALRAAGALGSAEDVKMLAATTHQGSDPEKQAAADALAQLRGEGINSALVATLQQADPEVRVVLLGILAKRNARDALPQVKDAAVDSNVPVRLAAVRALRFLAGKEDLPALIRILKQAADDEQRYAAELALLAVCGRVGQAGTESLIAGLADSDAATQVALLHALARIGNEAALKQTIVLTKAAEPIVQDEAVRLVSSWKDESVIAVLQDIAQSAEQQHHRVLALRGLVRIAAPGKDKAGKVELLRQVLNTSQRIDEKRLAVGVLGGIPTVEALELAAEQLQSPALSQEAVIAVARIAAEIGEDNKSKADAVVQQAYKVIQNEQIRKRVDEILKSEY
jgi:HEAT repeat protein